MLTFSIALLIFVNWQCQNEFTTPDPNYIPAIPKMDIRGTKDEIEKLFGQPDTIQSFQLENKTTGKTEHGYMLNFPKFRFHVSNHGFINGPYKIDEIEILGPDIEILPNIQIGTSFQVANKIVSEHLGPPMSDTSQTFNWYYFGPNGKPAGRLCLVQNQQKIINHIIIRITYDPFPSP